MSVSCPDCGRDLAEDNPHRCSTSAPKGTPPDPINAPRHYTEMVPPAIDVIDGWNLNFNLGNVIKYVARHNWKDGLKDLKKARWYLNREIEKHEPRTD